VKGASRVIAACNWGFGETETTSGSRYRQLTNSMVVEKAKVMSYQDVEDTRAKSSRERATAAEVERDEEREFIC
jgi:hypothetical protein